MSTIIWEVPEDSDFWPCPEGCGGATDDAAGGPCSACWRRIIDADRALSGGTPEPTDGGAP